MSRSGSGEAEATLDELRLVGEVAKIVNEKIDRTAANLGEKIEHTAAETQSLIKLSYNRLHRRVQKLEGNRRAVK